MGFASQRLVDAVQHLLTTIGDTETGSEDVTKGTVYIALTQHEERQRPQLEIMEDVRKTLAGLAGLQVAVNEIGDIWGARFQFACALAQAFAGPQQLIQLLLHLALQRIRRQGHRHPLAAQRAGPGAL